MSFFRIVLDRMEAERQAAAMAAAPPPLLDKPWRDLSWADRRLNLEHIREYQPENATVAHLRVLLYGPVGAGKSSFINSVSNVIRGRMSIPALASAFVSETSFTKQYETHKFKKGRGTPRTFYPLVFNDIMGLEPSRGGGVQADDINLALKGHVMEGHKFNPVSPLTEGDPGYNPSPTADDRVHVLVCVISANSTEINGPILEKMSSIREKASEMGIPQMAIMTNIDRACDEIEKDLRNVYRSTYLRKKMKDFSAAVGIPMNCIFPVKNYSEEIEMSSDVDSLILSALITMIDFGDDFIEKMQPT